MTGLHGPAEATNSPARLRAKLRGGEPVVGAMVGFASPDIIEMLGHAGYDFVTIDIEHEPIDDSAIMAMIRAADSVGLPAVVRSPMDHRVSTLLNFGAAGVQVPDVTSAQEVQQIVSRLRTPPRGSRGGSHLSRVAGYGAQPAVHLTNADDPVLIAMIEDAEVATRVEDLLTCDGVDAFHVGPHDLRASMGDPTDAELQEVIDRVVDACAATGAMVAVGLVSPRAGLDAAVATADDVTARRARGQRMFVVAISTFLARQLGAQRSQLAEALARATP
ncbi:HpcH/HpaI aldolase/citrate lyase family protein [Streptomyces paradoxus]|uniref:HpcH/HpaI aldolase/citrate lyase family protein n=1 Tax=Streptomyces paradoxus TaxID=66375 RepID=UPI0037CDB90B